MTHRGLTAGETAWACVRGTFLGLAAWGLLAHVLLASAQPVPAFWLPLVLVLAWASSARQGRPMPAAASPAPRWLAVTAFALLAGATLAVGYGAFATPPRQWDGAASWYLRARWLAQEPTLLQPALADPGVYLPSRDYPLLQPLLWASAMRLFGDAAGRTLAALLPFVLLTAGVGLAARRCGARPALAWLGALAAGSTPALLGPGGGAVDSGYGEPLLAACVLGLAAGLALRDRFLLAAALLLAPMTKPEGVFYGGVTAFVLWLAAERALLRAALPAVAAGTVAWLHVQVAPGTGALLVGLAAGAVGLGFLTDRVLPPSRQWRVLAAAAGAACSAVVLWRIQPHVEGAGGVLAAYLSGGARAWARLARLPAILAGLAEYALFVRKLGLLFPLLLLLALAPRRAVGRCPAPLVGAMLLGGLCCIVAAFLLSPEPELAHHQRSSLARLLLHWVGAGWLLAASWLEHTFRRTPGDGDPNAPRGRSPGPAACAPRRDPAGVAPGHDFDPP